MHRDISVVNLYLYDGRGLIGDLEFAKRRSTNVEHELRTVSDLVISCALN